ncbi:MAG: SCO family protein [Bacteroidales bacterium]|nr:SCO family protein [Bacteroidales bacterium]
MRHLTLRHLSALFLIVLFLVEIPSAFAQEELGIYEHLDEYISDDLVFTDELYNEINLKEAIDKPTVICLVYYECPGICSPLLNGLAEVADKSEMELGTDYQIFTISFNPAETPPLAGKKKKTYSKLVSHGDLENGWKFFTGDSTTIDQLLDEVGFKVKKEGKEFIHPASLIMLSPDGKITRYLHGSTYFLPFDLKMAIVEAAKGKSGPTINKVLNFCFSYDAEGKKYVFNVTKVSGTIILVLALSLLLSLVVKGNKKRKTAHFEKPEREREK